MSQSRHPTPRSARVPLRPLGTAEILDGAVRVVRRNARAAFTLAVPLAILRAGIGAALVLVTYRSTAATQLQQFGQLFGSVALSAPLAGLLAPVVLGDVLGERVDTRTALRRARGAWGVALLVALAVLIALGQTVGLVLAVVGGVWLWGIWAVAAPVLAVERLGVIASLKRSFALVRGQFFRTWGVRALGWLVTRALGLLITLPMTALAAAVASGGFLQSAGDAGRPGLFVTLTALGQLLAIALTSPITAAIDGLLYTDLRMRVEGLDLVVQNPASTVSMGAPPTLPPQPVSA